MIASSTSRPRARISAPSEILWRPTSNIRIPKKVTASTSGIDSATTSPVRRPSEKKHTSSTITTASASDQTNSSIERRTESGWLATSVSSMPTGSWAWMRAIAALRLRPRAMMSPPLAIDTPRPRASCPRKRKRGAGGSTKPRATRAMSPMRSSRPPARMRVSRIASTVS